MFTLDDQLRVGAETEKTDAPAFSATFFYTVRSLREKGARAREKTLYWFILGSLFTVAGDAFCIRCVYLDLKLPPPPFLSKSISIMLVKLRYLLR